MKVIPNREYKRKQRTSQVREGTPTGSRDDAPFQVIQVVLLSP